MPVLYLTEAITGRKIEIDTNKIKPLGVRPAPCFASQYGFFSAPYIDGKALSNSSFSMLDRDNFEMTQISIKNRRDLVFVLQTRDEISVAARQGIYDLHNNSPALAQRFMRELLHVKKFADIIHLPIGAGTDEALPYGHQQFATFSAPVDAIAGCLYNHQPLGSLESAFSSQPSLLLAAELSLPIANPGVKGHTL